MICILVVSFYLIALFNYLKYALKTGRFSYSGDQIQINLQFCKKNSIINYYLTSIAEFLTIFDINHECSFSILH